MRHSVLLTWLSTASGVMAQGDLAGLLQTQPDLSTLLDLITLAGVNDTLSGSSNITIMAPTNAAFDTLLELDIPESTAIRNRNVTAVTALLNNHVWRGLYPSSVVTDVPTYIQSFVSPDERSDVQTFTSITGGQYNGILRNGDGLAVLSGELGVSNVTTADIFLGDGIVIHVIDAALNFAPPPELFIARAGYSAFNGALTTLQRETDTNLTLGLDGANDDDATTRDITLFIPIDDAFESVASVLETADLSTLRSVVTYHILNENIVFSPSLGNTSATSLQGTDLQFSVFDDGTIFVNDAKILFPNVILSNGVGHIIDSVLNPSNSTFDRDALSPAAPASDRVQFANATSATSLPFSALTFTFATAESYTTPALLSTYLPVASAATTNASTIAPTSVTPVPTVVGTGAAALAQPCVTAFAVVAGGIMMAVA